MNIYLLTQSQITRANTFNSLVVIAKDAISASRIHPDFVKGWASNLWVATPLDVTVKLLGVAAIPISEDGVVAELEEGIVLVNVNR